MSRLKLSGLGLGMLLICLLGGCGVTPLERRPFFQVQFQGDAGWIWGGKSFRSLDGGRTWNAIETGYTQETDFHPAEMLGRVDFVNERVGFQSFKRGLQKSLDGGLTWRQFLPFRPSCLDFVSPDVGVVCEAGFRLTVDGGSSWRELNTIGVRTWDVCVFSRKELYYTAGSSLYRWDETDGASLVKNLGASNLRIRRHANDLWLVGARGLCMKYSTGDGAWEDFSVPSDEYIYDIGVGADKLIAAGPRGRLFHRNRGSGWEAVAFEDSEVCFASIDFAPDGTAFAVGGKPAFEWLWTEPGTPVALSSRDGRNWKRLELPQVQP